MTVRYASRNNEIESWSHCQRLMGKHIFITRQDGGVSRTVIYNIYIESCLQEPPQSGHRRRTGPPGVSCPQLTVRFVVIAVFGHVARWCGRRVHHLHGGGGGTSEHPSGAVALCKKETTRNYARGTHTCTPWWISTAYAGRSRRGSDLPGRALGDGGSGTSGPEQGDTAERRFVRTGEKTSGSDRRGAVSPRLAERPDATKIPNNALL